MPKVYITNINVCKLYWQCVFGGLGAHEVRIHEEHISLTGNHAKDFKGTQVKASAGNLQIFKDIRKEMETEGGRCLAVRQMFCGHRRQNL